MSDKTCTLEKERRGYARTRNYTLSQIKELAEAVDKDVSAAYSHTGSITFESASWKSDNTADYPNYYDIAITGVKATDRADIIFINPALADNFGVSTNTETSADNIRIRAVETPTVDLIAIYWIIHTGEGE